MSERRLVPPDERLAEDHTPEAVRTRIAAGPRPSYLRDFIYGAIDGTVTTFAVVAGATGANLAARLGEVAAADASPDDRAK